LDPNAGSIELYPQEVTRALLNLISNGFYAATRRKVKADDESLEPFLRATTRVLGKVVEIRIRAEPFLETADGLAEGRLR
jgi:two-component system, NtrC family, sensor kinase